MTENGLSAADVAAVTGGGRYNDGGMFGDNNGWWVIILLLALGRGFGFGGGGGFGGGCGVGTGSVCATPADVNAAVDQQTLISKLDQQTYGLADSVFALNNTITNGFAAAELSRANMAMDNMKCCCETQRLIERGFCDTNNTLHNTTRDVIDNQNCNARAILDALTAQRIADKDEKIAEQNQKIFALQLAASQAAQNQYLINEIRPCPIPAYITCNPYAASYGIGYNGGCGGNAF